MNFLDLVTNQYSVRDFSSKPIEKEKIEYVLEAARLAPSAVNYQPLYFIVIQEEKGKEYLHTCYNREWFKTAPLYILICGNHDQSWKRKDGKDFCDIDAAIAIEHIYLAAAEQGLGSCWVCNFDAEKCSELVELPAHVEPIAILPLGYENENAEKGLKKRKELQEIVRWERF